MTLIGTQACELELPETMGMHNALHVSLLRLFHCQRGEVANPVVVYVDGGEEFDTDHVIRHRGSKRDLEYLVRTSGYTSDPDSWEPASALHSAQDAVKQYRNKQHSRATAHEAGEVPDTYLQLVEK